jgi:uncharacterized protein (TIRG00374 family)
VRSGSGATGAAAPGPGGGRRIWWRWAGSAITLAILFLLLPRGAILDGVRSTPLVVLGLSIAAYLGSHLVGVVKWQLLVNAAGAGLPWRDAVRAYYWGLFGNLFLPSIVGGDVVRAGVAMKASRSGTAVVLGSLVDRIQDVVALGLVAGVGAALSPRALSPESRRIFIALGIALAAAAIAGVVLMRFLPVRRLRFGRRRLVVRVRRALRAATARPALLLAALSLGAVLQLAMVAINWWLGRTVGIGAPFYVWLFVSPLAKLAGLLPVTQGGIGVREAAQAALFAPFGVVAAQAVAAGLVFEAVLIVGGLLAGGISYLAGRATRAKAAEHVAYGRGVKDGG